MRKFFTFLLAFTAILSSNLFAQCNAEFNFTVNGSNGTVQFLPVNTTTAQHYWSFGDGASSAITAPTHTYAPGAYNVVHVVVSVSPNDSTVQCVDSAVRRVTIAGQPACDLTAAYTFARDSMQGNKVYFANLSTGSGANTVTSWSFGDGAASFEQNPVHVYASSGAYTVCLTVSNGNGCTDSVCNIVQVQAPSNPCNLSVNFVAYQDSFNQAFHFYNLISPQGAADSVQWLFGDGSSSAEQNPSHTYNQPGTYTVCLIARNFSGNTPCVREYCKQVTVEGTVPCNLHAAFTFTRDSVQTNKVYFNNISAGANPNTIVTWNFGDGSLGYGNNPTHIYQSSGAYTVCIAVRRDSFCVSDTCKTVQVQLPTNPCNLSVNFTAAIDSLQTNIVHFNNLSTPIASSDSVTWLFGDGTSSNDPLHTTHTYTQGGVFNVCLVVRKSGTNTTAPCVREFCQRIIVDTPQSACNLVVNFTAAIDSLQTNIIHFSNLSTPVSGSDSITWIFGDGTFSNDPLHTTHTYAQGGVFHVCLVVRRNGTAANVPCIKEYCQTIVVDTPQNVCNLQAYFVSSEDSINSNTIHFFNQSAPLLSSDSIYWSFGDGSGSSALDPSHTYAAPGTYTACLVITRFQGGTAVCARDYCKTIVVQQQPPQCTVVANFTAYSDSISGGNPFKYHFENTSTPMPGIDSSLWNFGDGTGWVNHNQSATHTYPGPGTYTVCLWVMRSGAANIFCEDRICKTIVVTGTPDVCDQLHVSFNWHADSLDKRKIYFVNQSSPLTANTFTNWSFGDGDSSMSASPVHVYAQPGTYTVCMQMRLGNSCVKDSCTIVVIPPSTVDSCNNNIYPSFVSYSDSLNRRKVYFSNTTATALSGLYAVWSFGDGTSATGWNAEHTYTIPGWYTVCLTVRTGNTCTRTICDSIFVPGNVIPPVNCDTFQLNFGYRRDYFMPNKLFFHATSNAPAYNQQWTFTQLGDSNYASVNQNNPVYVFPDAGVYRVCVKAAFSTACTKEFCDSVRITSNTVPSKCRLHCYPNPARNHVTFDVQLNQPGAIAVAVLNFHSAVVRNYTQQGAAGNNQVTLNIRDLPRGIYSARINYNGNTCFARFIKF